MTNEEIELLIKQALDKAFEYFKQGDYRNAEELYRQILRIDKDNSLALQMVSLAINHNGKNQEALEYAKIALKKDPNNFNFINNIALIYSSANDHKRAIEFFEKAIKIAPNESFLYVNLAIEYKKIGQIGKSFECFNKITNDKSEHSLFNYGAFLHELGRIEEAIFWYEKALKINYNFPVCHYNLSACLFLLEKYEKAWKEYEWRWEHFKQFLNIRNRFIQPYWNGQSLKNKTILLYGEQGTGDIIQFIRFAKELEGNVLIECNDDIKSLFSDFEIYTGKEQFDYHCSLISLGKILNKTPKNIKGNNYLKAKSFLSWENYKDLFKVGICWAGNPIHLNDKNRSMYLMHFKELCRNDVKVFSLQKNVQPRHWPGIGVVDLCSDTYMPLVDMSEYMNEWNDTASIINDMDLIITVDTSIAHLSGALGKKTLLLLPFIPDWRWGLKNNKTFWYDSIEIIRQKEVGNWTTVMNEAKNYLNQQILRPLPT